MIFFLVDFYSSEFFSSQTDGQTDRQTDGQTDRRKATHKSPPCMGTGGLKNLKGVYIPHTKKDRLNKRHALDILFSGGLRMQRTLT